MCFRFRRRSHPQGLFHSHIILFKDYLWLRKIARIFKTSRTLPCLSLLCVAYLSSRRAEQSISESKGLCSPHGGCKYSLGAMTGSSLQAVAHPRLKPFTTNSAIIDTSPISLMQLNNSNTAAAQRTSEIFATGRLQQSQSLLELPRPTGMSLGELTHSVAAQADQLYAPHTQLTARLQPVKGVQPPMRVHGGVWVSKEERKTKTNLAIEKHWDTKFRPTSGRAATGGPNIVYEVKSPLTNDNAETHLCTLTGQNMFVHHKASTLRT